MPAAGNPQRRGVANPPNASDSGLVLSWPIPYDHDMIYDCLQGMTFLALDFNRWQKNSIAEIVAPGNERQKIKAGLGLPTGSDLVDVPLAIQEAHRAWQEHQQRGPGRLGGGQDERDVQEIGRLRG